MVYFIEFIAMDWVVIDNFAAVNFKWIGAEL